MDEYGVFALGIFDVVLFSIFFLTKDAMRGKMSVLNVPTRVSDAKGVG